MGYENIIIAIITAIISPVLVLWLKHKFYNKPHYKNKGNIKDHPLFAELSYKLSVSINKICIPNDILKTKMVRKFLKFKLQAIENNFKQTAEMVSNGDHLTVNHYRNVITKIINDYESKAEADNIPEIFIRRFSEWHTPKVEIIKDVIEYICRSNIYASDAEKLSAVLDIILMVLHTTLMDIEHVANEMNGELSEILIKYEKTRLK